MAMVPTQLWISEIRRKKDLGDILDMAGKEFDGKLVSVEGSLATSGELCAYTPASGKTFYLAGSHFSGVGGAPLASYTVHGELQNDGTVKDNAGFGGNETGSRYWGTNQHGVFQLKGDSLDGDGIKKYSINLTNGDSITIEGMLYGFIENDADDPRL